MSPGLARSREDTNMGEVLRLKFLIDENSIHHLFASTRNIKLMNRTPILLYHILKYITQVRRTHQQANRILYDNIISFQLS